MVLRRLSIPTLERERALWRAGYRRVAGVDEAGRGPLAGPVVAGAVVLPPEPPFPWLAEVRDSKALPPARREELADRIRRDALAWAVAEASVPEIERLGILKASLLAMERAVRALPLSPDFVLVDGPYAPQGLGVPCQPVRGGDACSLSIACASILAKVHRDRRMEELDALYPGYGFARHKGYPTPEHRSALRRLGPSPIHRHTYGPVREAGREGGR